MKFFTAISAVLIGLASCHHDGGRDWPSHNGDITGQRAVFDKKGINKHNVHTLEPVWQRTLNGSITATPVVVDGKIYVPDFGGAFTCLRESDGTIIWQIKVSDATGVPFSAARASAAVSQGIVVIGDNANESQGIAIGHGIVMGFDANTGALLWKTVVDDHPAAIITQSPLIEKDYVYIGVSSNEEANAAFIPNYPCCDFVGKFLALNLHTGAIIWQVPMIPADIAGVGKYSGSAIWGSAPSIDGDGVLFAVGNLYDVPAEVEEAEANRQPGDPSVIDPRVIFNAMVKLNKKTGKLIWKFLADKYDAWTVSCIVPSNPQNCPTVPGPDADFGQSPMITRNMAICGQKSGVMWSRNKNTGNAIWSVATAPGGTVGGHQWGSSLLDDGCDFYVFGTNVNSNKLNFTLQDGTVYNGSFWTGINGRTGEIVWETVNPRGPGPMLYSTTTVSNDIVFGSTLDSNGLMLAMDAKTGEILWQFTSNGGVASGPSIVGNRVYWGNGYTRIFGSFPGSTLYAFETN